MTDYNLYADERMTYPTYEVPSCPSCAYPEYSFASNAC